MRGEDRGENWSHVPSLDERVISIERAKFLEVDRQDYGPLMTRPDDEKSAAAHGSSSTRCLRRPVCCTDSKRDNENIGVKASHRDLVVVESRRESAQN